MPHASLCGQWILLAGLAIALDPARAARSARRGAARMAVLSAVAVFVHPVLAVTTVAFALAMLARLAMERALSPRALAGFLAATVAAVAASSLALGYATGPSMESEGFGEFSADLLFLLNPMGLSRFVPALPMRELQYEGYGYLGLGVIALGALAGTCLVRRRLRWTSVAARWGPLVAVAVVMTLFALSWRVTFAGRSVLELDALYAPIAPVASAFRSSGRFVWPLHYLLVAGALAVVLRSWADRPRAATGALAVALALQVADVSVARRPDAFAEERWRLGSEAWALAANRYRHVALVPPEIHSAGGTCDGPYDWDYYVPIAYEAYRLGATASSWRSVRALDGHASRPRDPRGLDHAVGTPTAARSSGRARSGGAALAPCGS
jgi:hypothetical protein